MLITRATGREVSAIVLGCYEVLTGRMPGGTTTLAVAATASPPLPIRLTADVGVLVGITVCVLAMPHSLLAYGVGTAAAALSLGIIVIDRRSLR